MTQVYDSMMHPKIEVLMGKVDSKFKLVTLAAMRARQINAYYGHVADGPGTAVPPQVTAVARKPLSIAFEEIAADMIRSRPLDPDELGDGEAPDEADTAPADSEPADA